MTINDYEIVEHRGDPIWKGDTGVRWLIYKTKDKHPNCPISSEMSWQDAWDTVIRMILQDNGLEGWTRMEKLIRGENT